MKRFAYILFLGISLITGRFIKSQTIAVDNKVSESVTFHPIPDGRNVYGIFEGRSPCAGVMQQLNPGVPSGCDHIKWRVIFFRDTITGRPTTFSLNSDIFADRHSLTGSWKIIRGTKTNNNAVVYALNYSPGKNFYLLKGDENVLFILDENRDYRVGDQDFSYTLNRVRKVLKPASPKTN